MEYSEWQKAIFNHIQTSSKNLVIQAYAGVGKTTTLVAAMGYVPNLATVLFLAFNKKIANELEERAPKNAVVKTCHSYGYAALRMRWNKFLQLDNTRNIRLVEETFVEFFGKDHGRNTSNMERLVSLAKCDMLTKASSTDLFMKIMRDFQCGPELEEQEELYADIARKVLAKTLIKDRVISYDDMVYIPAVLGFSAGKYDYVFVDEVQDLNMAQLALLDNAVGLTTKCVFCGDSNQAIYAFRKADMNGIDKIIKKYKCDVLKLPITYRCGKNIVERAKKFVPDYQAAPTNIDGVVNNDVALETMVQNVQPKDFVLSRKNAPLMKLCLKVLSYGIPATVVGKDIGANLISLVAKSKKKTIPSLISWLDTYRSLEKEKIIKKGGDQETIDKRIEAVEDKVECVLALCEDVVSVSDLNFKMKSMFSDENFDKKVVFSSVHKAKGLETNQVWMLSSTFKSHTKEECNITYVAMTRAKNVLNIVTEQV